MAMAGVEHRDAAGKIDVALAFDVPQLGVGGAFCVYGQGIGDPARNGGESTLVQFGIGAHGHSSGSQ